jgi:hypothetical protein
MLGRRIQDRVPPVQNIRQLEAAAITTGHPTSNWRDETRVEAIIQALGGYTRY